MFRVLAAVMAVLFVFSLVALAQSQKEIEEVVNAITGDLALAGLALSAIVVMVVGLIRRFTGLDGRREVQLLVLAVSILAVAVYNVLEGGMPFGASVLAALAVFVGAIGEHETVGKWLRQILTDKLGESLPPSPHK